MPTPFYHLFIIKELLSRQLLPLPIQKLLTDHLDYFSFGSVAPDVQTVSGQSRFDTHFFKLPYQDGTELPWEVMLAEYPSLDRLAVDSVERAVFIAGYLCHLQADWLWVLEIFIPNFGSFCEWGSFQRRLCLHNVLRAHLDEKILPLLSPGSDVLLAEIKGIGWLPFVEDEHLFSWRDLLVNQLRPNAPSHTVEIFSSREGISPDEFNRILRSDELIEKEIYSHLPRQRLQNYIKLICNGNLHLLTKYLA